ncbi:hypothetical protein WOLCODRAFT_94405 [Wolfiporia cocos MD-104 SS10]|uniref:ARM repeat-containing protein n=1 Tax=Wolfiporia cocos (strain MD-104) TaxID=742152 RepID=A0A2H3J567_WOLCO|nr:hypothetical protein WOLCODRAFT_94405 [Wolfiporia cocos MD-104 SS10]
MPIIMQCDEDSQATFQKLKVSCVPLLQNSLLIPAAIPTVLKLLLEVFDTLRTVQDSGHALRTPLITYVFFPLSSILRRNTLSTIPDQVLERILNILGILCESWWWELDETTWEQVFMLCSAILGGIDSKGKDKVRDDETKEATVRCLWTLLRERTPDQDPFGPTHPPRMAKILTRFQTHAQTRTFTPVLGQTLDTLLVASESPHLSLQRSSLQVLHVLVQGYLPNNFTPTVLPGVVSIMGRIALATGSSKTWANGEVVAAALQVMQAIIIRSIGDEICVKEGAVKGLASLEDLADLVDAAGTNDTPTAGERIPYMTARTTTWLHGTASQLHIAMNALTSLVNHPNPSALLALVDFSEVVLSATTLTVPQSQPLLLCLLLSLSGSSFTDVSTKASAALRHMLSPASKIRHTLLPVLMQISKDNLSALPRLILSHSDAKVEHVAGLIESVCRLSLALEGNSGSGVSQVSAGISILLGPAGGIEKWGWSLLAVLEFTDSPIMAARRPPAQLMLETDWSSPNAIQFPELTLEHVTSRSAHAAIEQMLRSMGRAGRKHCDFAIDWFLAVGMNRRGRRAVAALWCACRLLEGVSGVCLDASHPHESGISSRPSRRIEKLARGVARRISDLWMNSGEDEDSHAQERMLPSQAEEGVLVEHVKGLTTVRATPNAVPRPTARPSLPQPLLHKCVSLQILAVTAGILEARFAPLLLHTLYPILHSIVSDSPLVSSTALAALDCITRSTSYASPANLLLSNFDYALDAVSRRLTRRWLDIDATKVLVVLVRLVGADVVQKAGDVVEECFDRLDEFHGYEVLVDGLVEVLTEVVKVVEDSEQPAGEDVRPTNSNTPEEDVKGPHAFVEWYERRHNRPMEINDSIRDEAPPTGESGGPVPDLDPNAKPSMTPSQALTQQIISRSFSFLTHGSPVVRMRMLMLLTSAVAVVPESALPTIHQLWPYILNRFSDQEPFVVSAAASLVEALATHKGDFMFRRIWDDIWPRFRAVLDKLSVADSTNALARRDHGGVGTESAYTHSHRLYRSLLRTMTAAVTSVQVRDSAVWEVILAFRHFLHCRAHEELQARARALYSAICLKNEDAVWLALSATQGQIDASMSFLTESRWDIGQNMALIFSH